jgi:hypothetical protein
MSLTPIESKILSLRTVSFTDTTPAFISGLTLGNSSVNEIETIDTLIATAIKFISHDRNDSIEVYSNSKGVFNTHITAGTYDILISYVGFQILEIKNIDFKASEVKELKILLGQMGSSKPKNSISIKAIYNLSCDTAFVPTHFHDSNSLNSKIVDYKSNSYQIALDENYKTTEKLKNWTWASEEDPDGRIDSTGSDAFLFLGEPLMQYNNQDWLPVLFIQTYNNRITSFTCSILFELADSTNAEMAFLQLLSHDIERLKNKDVLTALSQKGVYQIQNQNVIEELKLTKGQDLHLDKFEYTVRQR